MEAPPLDATAGGGPTVVDPEPERSSKERMPRERASPPGADFARAMEAFSAGNYGKAEQLFLAFERAHPGDARVEDGLFLRAVARWRRGDAEGAREIARDYLVRFPNGLRSVEAQRMAR